MTTASLPEELAPWSALLAGLAEPLQAPVGAMVREVDALVGPLRPRRPLPTGAPDGYNGIARRGPYDRLVLSEWALLDAAPDEFLRRAANLEHGFYAIDHRSPATGLHCDAIFDAGPESLGGPRLVHVALLVVLARRAEVAGARFTWGIVQDPGLCREGAGRADLLALLQARSGRPAAPADHDARLGPAADVDERWYVGGPGVRALADGKRGVARSLALALVEDVVDQAGPADVDRVALSVRAGGATRSRVLALPPPATRRRLMTDPTRPVERFTPPETPRTPASWRTFPRGIQDPVGVRFVAGTEQLACFFASGVVLTWSTRKLGRMTPRPQFGATGPTPGVVAMGYQNQHILTVERSRGGEVVGHGAYFRRTWAAPAPEPGPMGFAVTDVQRSRLLHTDGHGTLFDVRFSGQRAGGGLGAEVTTHPVTVEDMHTGNGGWWMLDSAELVGAGLLPVRTFAARWLGRPGLSPPLPLVASEALLLPPHSPGYASWVAWGDGAELQAAHLLSPGAPDAPPTTGSPRALARPAGVLVGVGQPSFVVVTWDAPNAVFRVGDTDKVVSCERTPIAPRLSLDGSLLAFTTAEGTLEVWRVADGSPVLLRHGSPVPGLAEPPGAGAGPRP